MSLATVKKWQTSEKSEKMSQNSVKKWQTNVKETTN